MAVIFTFCDQDELKGWIVDLCKKKDLGVLCLGNENTWKVVSPDALVFSDASYQFFLFPSRASLPPNMAMNDVKPRDWGWITVRPGGVKKLGSKSVLMPTEIHGEPSSLDTADPEGCVRWLKRRLRPVVRCGVLGRNVVTGGESIYKSMCYTQKAKQLFDAGVVWKQLPSDSSVFEPLDS